MIHSTIKLVMKLILNIICHVLCAVIIIVNIISINDINGIYCWNICLFELEDLSNTGEFFTALIIVLLFQIPMYKICKVKNLDNFAYKMIYWIVSVICSCFTLIFWDRIDWKVFDLIGSLLFR